MSLTIEVDILKRIRRNLVYVLAQVKDGLPCFDFYVVNPDGTTTLWDCETGEVSTIHPHDAMRHKRHDYIRV